MTLNKNIDIVGIGASTIDIFNVVDHFPDREEVQKSILSLMDGGGPVATALVTAAKLGAKTIMIDSLGNDWIGIDIREEFRKYGVDTSYIKVTTNCNSSFANILVRKEDGARTIIYSPGNTPELKSEDIPVEIISESKFLHINGRHLNACLRACEIAKSFSTKISFDGGAHRFRTELTKVIPFVDVLVASKQFAVEYTNEKNINSAAEELMNLGIETIVLTDGINGSWLYTEEIFAHHQPAFINKKVVDTTGCGDSYHGAFLYYLCNSNNVKDAMIFASAIASINASTLGGRRGLPSKEEVDRFLNKQLN